MSAMEDFLCWLSTNGVSVDHLEVFDFPETGRGLRATRNIPAGETLLTVPLKLIITSEAVLFNSDLSITLQKFNIDNGIQILCLFLLYERHNPTSFWKPYLSILPKQFNDLIHFNNEELEALQCTLKKKWTIQKKQKLKEEVEKLRQILQNEESLRVSEWLTFEDYLWARSCVMSRSFWLIVSEKVTKIKQNYYSIIPFADLFNHSPTVETRGVFDKDAQVYRIQTFTEYHKGDQVFCCYGPHSNETLLKYYGFVLSDNKFSFIRIFPPWDELNIVDKEWKLELLTEFHLNEGKYSITENEISWNLITKLKIFFMEKCDYDHCSNAFLDDEISVENEWRVWSFLREHIQKRLLDKTSTIEEDEKYLREQSPKLSYNHKCAIKLRIEEKRILKSILIHIEKKLDSLRKRR